MLLIAGTIRFPKDKIREAHDAMARMIEASRAEDGCEHYAFAEDVLDPGLIHISELWRDQAAFQKHGASAHMAVWRKAGGELGLSSRDVRIYEVDEGRRL
jgi:quinol monooxygenase YgiN